METIDFNILKNYIDAAVDAKVHSIQPKQTYESTNLYTYIIIIGIIIFGIVIYFIYQYFKNQTNTTEKKVNIGDTHLHFNIPMNYDQQSMNYDQHHTNDNYRTIKHLDHVPNNQNCLNEFHCNAMNTSIHNGGLFDVVPFNN